MGETSDRLREGIHDLTGRLGLNRPHDRAFFNIASEFDDLVAHLRRHAGRRRPVVLIDGGSGAGKSTLADALSHTLGWATVSLDDCYPGWHGLADGATMVWRDILAAHLPGYRRWDWHASAPADWVTLDPTAPIIVEGCGAITPESVGLATSSIWFQRDAATRRRLALARGGNGDDDGWWDVWEAQEADHWDRDEPQTLADVIVVDVTAPQLAD